MCVRIHRAAIVTNPWDADTVTITIPAHLDHAHALRAVRWLLAEMGTPQPNLGALCFCGEQVIVPAAAYAEVITRGA
jgi:hypothetical protein